MREMPEWFRNPKVLPEGALYQVNPGDIDYSRVISIAPNREELTFATHDRTELVRVSYASLEQHQRRMTMREWREVEKALVKYDAPEWSKFSEIKVVGGGGLLNRPSERLTRQNAGRLAKAMPNPFDESRVSETDGIRAQAKEVMNATSDDALAIILSEIAASDDPREAASQWMTRFTTDVAAIIREGEADG